MTRSHHRIGKSLVVSIHDVHPRTWEHSEQILADLADHGIRKTSLLVVPNFHERAPISHDPKFLARMLELEQAGHEIVLHGYYHKRRRRRGESLRKKFITRLYTNGEGEFFDIGEARALRQVTRGLGNLRQAGLQPAGFIAPAWLLSDEGELATSLSGLEYTTRLTNVKDLRSGLEHESQSLVYSVRSSLRAMASLRWNARLFDRLKGNPLIRLGIHPPDFDHPRVKKQILKFIDQAFEDERMPRTYHEWVQLWRNGDIATERPHRKRSSSHSQV